jgi:hypothetical protein
MVVEQLEYHHTLTLQEKELFIMLMVRPSYMSIHSFMRQRSLGEGMVLIAIFSILLDICCLVFHCTDGSHIAIIVW